MADWDERYARGEHATEEPSRLLVHAVEKVLPRPARDKQATPCALDLACGAGRHALYLAARGWRVVAVDASRVGIELTRERARKRGLEVEARVADLESGQFRVGAETFDLVCDFYYLQRDLFPQLRAGLRRGGAFVASIHLVDDGAEVKPMNPDFLLRPGELRAEFDGWNILHYHETSSLDDDAGEHHRRSAEMIAVKP